MSTPLNSLEEFCKEFIAKNKITCGEDIHQSDWVGEAALGFIEGVCERVGYYSEKHARADRVYKSLRRLIDTNDRIFRLTKDIVSDRYDPAQGKQCILDLLALTSQLQRELLEDSKPETKQV